jgi:hypothetical protein
MAHSNQKLELNDLKLWDQVFQETAFQILLFLLVQNYSISQYWELHEPG